MNVTRIKNTEELDIILNGTRMEEDRFRYLGVDVDKNHRIKSEIKHSGQMRKN